VTRKKRLLTPTEPHVDENTARVCDALAQALEGLLTALVAVGGLPTEQVPSEALDLALKQDKAYRIARVKFNAAWSQLMDVDEPVRLTALTAEAAANHVAAQAAEVGFKLGILAAGKHSPGSRG